MIKGKLIWLWIVFLVVSIVFGITIAGVKYNVPPHTIQMTLTASGLVFTILGRLFSKGDTKAIVVSPSEKKLVSSLNSLAGWSLLAVVLGVIIGFYVVGYLDRMGINSSGYEVLFLLVVYPAAVLIIYLTKRSQIMRQQGSLD